MMFIFSRRWLRGQAPVHAVEEPHQLGQGGHPDEGDDSRKWVASSHQGTWVDRILGQQDHILHSPSLIPPCFLLDIQVINQLVITLRERSSIT